VQVLFALQLLVVQELFALQLLVAGGLFAVMLFPFAFPKNPRLPRRRFVIGQPPAFTLVFALLFPKKEAKFPKGLPELPPAALLKKLVSGQDAEAVMPVAETKSARIMPVINVSLRDFFILSSNNVRLFTDFFL